MANVALQPSIKKPILDGDIDFLVDDFRFALIDTDDHAYSASDEFISELGAGAVVAETGILATPTTTGGTFDAADPTFTGAGPDDPCEAMWLFRDTGVDATSRLCSYFDTGVGGLPVTPNGGDITVGLNASGIFSL